MSKNWHGGRSELWKQIFIQKWKKLLLHVLVEQHFHPFYTGTQGKVKKTGKIEQFNRKFGLNQEQK